MATCNYIRESKQNASAMRAVIHYVSQACKTMDEQGRQYLTGSHCNAVFAYDEFMATKHLYGKANGVYFYQYTQSFQPGEIRSFEEAHNIGIKLATDFFPKYEVLVATHLDAVTDGEQRIHNHFIINSVSFEDGKKIHFDTHTLERMRAVSDRICKEHGLSVLPVYQKDNQNTPIGTREYRATIKGEGWKFQLINDIEAAMTAVGSKSDFCSMMESAGYAVSWTDTRKYITYTCPNGRKVRDIKLHETKFLKENMAHEFAIRERSNNFVTGENGARQAEIGLPHDGQGGDRTAVSANRLCDPDRGLGGVSELLAGGCDLSAGAVPENLGAGDQAGVARPDHADVAGGAGVGRRAHAGGDGIGGADHSASTDRADRNARPARTGWEDARRIFEQAQMGGGDTAEQIRGAFERGEKTDAKGFYWNRSSFGTDQRGDLPADEISGLFAEGQALPDGDWEDAESGNPYAAESPKPMRVEDHLFLAANILELVGRLADPEPERRIRDCTTLPRPGRKQRAEHEQSM